MPSTCAAPVRGGLGDLENPGSLADTKTSLWDLPESISMPEPLHAREHSINRMMSLSLRRLEVCKARGSLPTLPPAHPSQWCAHCSLLRVQDPVAAQVLRRRLCCAGEEGAVLQCCCADRVCSSGCVGLAGARLPSDAPHTAAGQCHCSGPRVRAAEHRCQVRSHGGRCLHCRALTARRQRKPICSPVSQASTQQRTSGIPLKSNVAWLPLAANQCQRQMHCSRCLMLLMAGVCVVCPGLIWHCLQSYLVQGPDVCGSPRRAGLSPTLHFAPGQGQLSRGRRACKVRR